MLVSSRMANSLPEEASPDELDLLGDESREASDADKSDSENSGRVQVITIDGKTDAKEVVARLKDVLSGNSPRTGSKSLLDEVRHHYLHKSSDGTCNKWCTELEKRACFATECEWNCELTWEVNSFQLSAPKPYHSHILALSM